MVKDAIRRVEPAEGRIEVDLAFLALVEEPLGQEDRSGRGDA